MFLKYNIWGILWVLFIFIASAIPGEQLPPSPVIGFDKFGHLVIYGVLQYFLLRGFLLQQTFPFLRKYHVGVAFIKSITYGILMEFMQESVFRNRSFDVYDMMANICGVVICTLLWMIFIRKNLKTKVN
jgi:glycopeptide antibiotics resistance protein